MLASLAMRSFALTLLLGAAALASAQQVGTYVQDLQDSLISFAASDFATHGPRPAGFRDVDLRYRENDHGARSYMICGQFRLTSESEPDWADFATIKTDPYEQWVGDSAADMCARAIPVSPDSKDLSPELQSVLGGDTPSVKRP